MTERLHFRELKKSNYERPGKLQSTSIGVKRKLSSVEDTDIEPKSISKSILPAQMSKLFRIFTSMVSVINFRNASIGCQTNDSTLANIHRQIEVSSRHTLELAHLGQILTIWPESFELKPVLSMVQGKKVETYEIRLGSADPGLDLVRTFRLRIGQYLDSHGVQANVPSSALPELPAVSQHRPGQNGSKQRAIESLMTKKQATPLRDMTNTEAKGPTDSNESRRTSLKDRIKMKENALRAQKPLPSKAERESKVLMSRLPRLLEILGHFLLIHPARSSFSSGELASSIVSSFKESRAGTMLSEQEALQMLELLEPFTAGWMVSVKIGCSKAWRFSKADLGGKQSIRKRIDTYLHKQGF